MTPGGKQDELWANEKSSLRRRGTFAASHCTNVKDQSHALNFIFSVDNTCQFFLAWSISIHSNPPTKGPSYSGLRPESSVCPEPKEQVRMCRSFLTVAPESTTRRPPLSNRSQICRRSILGMQQNSAINTFTRLPARRYIASNTSTAVIGAWT